MVAAGWGKVNDCKLISTFKFVISKLNYFILKASSISPLLNKLKVAIVTNEKCKQTFGNIVQATTLCAIGLEGATGTCQVS